MISEIENPAMLNYIYIIVPDIEKEDNNYEQSKN